MSAFRPAVLAGLARSLVVWALFAFVLAVQPAGAAPTFPPLTGRVVDDAHILSPGTQAGLTQDLAGLEQKTSRQLVVVTLPSLQGYDIADYGYQLGRAWGIGQKGTNNGAIFIVAPNERKVWVTVGYGLEGVLTDAETKVIVDREVLPRFRQKDMEGGIVAGARALIQQLSLDTSTAEQRAAQAEQQQVYERRAYRGHGSPIAGIVVFFVIIWVIMGVLRGGGGFGGFLGGMFLGSLLGGRRYDDWGGGGGWGGGDGGGGGGGFSGGGGSFGGGGAGGSW